MVTGLPVESLAGLWTQRGLSPALSGAFPVAATAIFGGIKQGLGVNFDVALNQRRIGDPTSSQSNRPLRESHKLCRTGQSQLPKTMPRNVRGAGPL
jgi:hypothetical protein